MRNRGHQTMNDDFVIVHACEALASGILKVVPPLANETASAGTTTVVVHGRRPETPTDLESIFDKRVRLVPVMGWGDRSFASTIRAAAVLRQELARHEGGVLHMHSTHAGLIGRLVPARGWNRFYTPQGYAFLNASHSRKIRSLALLTEILLARRAHTLASSRAEGALAAQLLRGNRVSVVQNGLDTGSATAAAPGRNSHFVVASLGRASYQRRPDLFAELAALLSDEADVRFEWFGDGPESEILAGAGVEVSGWLPQSEVPTALGSTNVVIHFSAFEGLPLALLEAMTAGRPIVATDLPVIREVVGDTAMLVGTPSEAADAVRELYADGELRAELARRASERVGRLFTRRAMIERTLAAYGLDEAPVAR